MADTDFSAERLLQQASGNQSALFFVTLAWAKQRDGSVDAWAQFVGDQFAESWNEIRGGGAREVARIAGLNFASSADSTFVRLDGDAARAEAVIEGPDPEWLEGTDVTVSDSDRANELIFGRIAEHLGLALEVRRDDAGLHLIFSTRESTGNV
jgi:hypothetical protein